MIVKGTVVYLLRDTTLHCYGDRDLGALVNPDLVHHHTGFFPLGSVGTVERIFTHLQPWRDQRLITMGTAVVVDDSFTLSTNTGMAVFYRICLGDYWAVVSCQHITLDLLDCARHALCQ